MIRLRGLARAFGAFALGPLSLRITRGEYWVLLGPSGAGKSMLLETIAGLHPPDRGSIELAGKDVTAAPPEARGVGFVFQHSALFPHLTVRQNIAYGPSVRGAPRADRERRVDELAVTLRLAGVLARPVATLSGGEAQKIAIARALAPHPEVLLLDEPLGPIDHNGRLELQAELRRIHGELGLTMLHVTHSRDEARALATHCALLVGGRLVQAGPVDDVFTRPRCFFAAHFLGVDPTRAGAVACEQACLRAPGACDGPDEAAA